MDNHKSAMAFIHDRARILGVEVAGDAIRLRAECSNGMTVDLVPAEAEDATYLLELADELVGAYIVFGGYLRMTGPGAFHVTALSLGLDHALALRGNRHGLR
ncbi:hypothetical protein [Paeniglutamicibacter kerguelensis]|uniref:Uncharacterized protein n=1 Tax=Paeniglutamicibacter kerguelensis TaxID=254788 RepID=A0ABS4XAZ5_9MICC|nr:hypothetical protein [Paeniglutamicibacter kerguelensis]MBP2385418.1 hypothetical protein [Paeniglutamicibacter kerguelensis]